MSTWSIMLGVAAVLAIVVSALFIGVCLLIAWTTDALRGHTHDDLPPAGADGRRGNAPGLHVVSWHGDR